MTRSNNRGYRDMTRRDLIVEAGKLAGLFAGVVGLGAGCGGDRAPRRGNKSSFRGAAGGTRRPEEGHRRVLRQEKKGRSNRRADPLRVYRPDHGTPTVQVLRFWTGGVPFGFRGSRDSRQRDRAFDRSARTRHDSPTRPHALSFPRRPPSLPARRRRRPPGRERTRRQAPRRLPGHRRPQRPALAAPRRRRRQLREVRPLQSAPDRPDRHPSAEGGGASRRSSGRSTSPATHPTPRGRSPNRSTSFTGWSSAIPTT